MVSLKDLPYEAVYTLFHLPVVLLRALLRGFFIVRYRRKGKVVPTVKNPLLLKSASTIARYICEGKCRSEDVMQAYIQRITEVEPYINATAELCFEDALKKSREVDELIASEKFNKDQLILEKPLFGVPISVKCLFHVKDMACTGGCILYSDVIATEDAPAVAALKKAGAIVIATTNAPELGIDIETCNKLYGRTCNPYDTNRTCGGSSGGEAALIGAGASVLGLGNDILGSLRIPAHFSGIFSHKPSRGLVSNHGACPVDIPNIPKEASDDEAYKYLASGPMCRYAEDLVTSMKILALDSEVKLKFDHSVDFKKVRIYYLREIHSPLVTPTDKEIVAALKNVVSYFEKQYNITPQEVEMPFLFDVDRCILTVMEPVLKAIKVSRIKRGFGLNEKSEFIKSLTGNSKLCSSTSFKLSCISNPLIFRSKHISHYESLIYKWTNEFDKILYGNSILLMPTFPVPAPYHLETFPLLPNICYTGLFNVLGLPATICPLGFTEEGLPCGIQIVGDINNDPLTIACAIELEKAFGGWRYSKMKEWIC